MQDFQTVCLEEAEHSIVKRITKELYILVLLQIFLFFMMPITFSIELSLILMYVLLMSTKQRRIVYSISFYPEKVVLKYYKYIFFRKEISIDKNEFTFIEKQKRLGLGATSGVLSILNNKKHVGDINMASTWAWGEDKYAEIQKILHKKI